jgi:signal transduction histidine kinase/DNA-binding response OmpR family regulator
VGDKWRLHPNRTLNLKRFKERLNDLYLPVVASELEAFTLPGSAKVMSIGFGSLKYPSPSRVQFAVKMLGFDQDWQYIGSQHTVSYTKLAPGNYTFQVKAANADGQFSSHVASLKIKVLAPWYKKWWATLGYIIVAFTLLYFFLRHRLERWRLQQQLEMKEQEKESIKTLSKLKTNFYTNITHEFRTPLTLILGAAQQIQEQPEKWAKSGARAILKGGNQLLGLVNQLLDLSKLDSGLMKLNLVQADLLAYLRYILESFGSLAASKGVELRFVSDLPAFYVDFDPDKMLQLINNLLSNAIKFTPSGGVVTLSLDAKRKNYLLQVKDTGIGITPDEQVRIFDRFYQVDGSSTRAAEGTGIGLSLVHELVKLHGGKIAVESFPEVGTTFSLELPLDRKMDLIDEAQKLPDVQIHVAESQEPEEKRSGKKGMPTILIVEDSKDVARYIKSVLEDDYQVSLAQDGEMGIQMALEEVPDAIITDVMMPKKDGFELCQTLKHDERTSHIPILMLTAKVDDQSLLDGLSRGADEYLAKPFNKQELMIRLNNLISIRQKLQVRYQQQRSPLVISLDPALEKEDKFFNRFLGVLEKRYTEPAFDLASMCEALHLSSKQLNSKLKALTERSFLEYLIEYRLEKARVLLRKTDWTISEVAHQVGYDEPNYFTRLYKRKYGNSPSEERKNPD